MEKEKIFSPELHSTQIVQGSDLSNTSKVEVEHGLALDSVDANLMPCLHSDANSDSIHPVLIESKSLQLPNQHSSLQQQQHILIAEEPNVNRAASSYQEQYIATTPYHTIGDVMTNLSQYIPSSQPSTNSLDTSVVPKASLSNSSSPVKLLPGGAAAETVTQMETDNSYLPLSVSNDKPETKDTVVQSLCLDTSNLPNRDWGSGVQDWQVTGGSKGFDDIQNQNLHGADGGNQFQQHLQVNRRPWIQNEQYFPSKSAEPVYPPGYYTFREKIGLESTSTGQRELYLNTAEHESKVNIIMACHYDHSRLASEPHQIEEVTLKSM